MLLNKSCFSQKTKATPKDRQWLRTKPRQNSRYQAGGLGKILRPQIEDGECRQLATVGRVQKCTLPGYQPFGSMPRCCNSLRSMRFIQVANDESPSLRISSSSWDRSSWAKRSWYWSVLALSLDIVITKSLLLNCGCNYNVNHVFLQLRETAKPGSARTLTGLLTTNQQKLTIIVQEVAMRNNNTQRERALPFTVCNAYFEPLARCVFCFAAKATVSSKPNDTPRRPSMVLLVGERSRSLANLLAGLPIPASNATSTAVKKHLRTYNGLSYVYPAPHKTGVGCESPNMYKATPDAESVFFVVCYMCHSMAWYAKQQGSYNRRSPAILSYHAANNGAVYCLPFGVNLPLLVRVTVISRANSTSRRQRMVTLAGQPQGWPVPLYAGTLTPVNVTAPIECESLGGDSLNLYKEAA